MIFISLILIIYLSIYLFLESKFDSNEDVNIYSLTNKMTLDNFILYLAIILTIFAIEVSILNLKF